MPDNRGLAFSSGFNAGAGAITNRRRMDLLEKQNQQEQRELQRKKLDEAFESGIAEIANQVKTLTPVIYSSDGKGKADAEIALRKGRSVIFDDLNKMANIAVDNQYMTPEEANLVLQRATLAGESTDPRPAQDLAARGEQVGEQGKTLGKETAISSDVAQANRDADNARAIKLRQTQTSQNITTKDITKPTQTSIEGTLLSTGDAINRLRNIRGSVKEEYFKLWSRAGFKVDQIKSILGDKPSPEDAEALKAFQTFQSETFENFNLYVKSITGAAMSNQEAQRIEKAMPVSGEGVWPKQSYEQFIASLTRVERMMADTQIRYKLMKDQGLSTGDIEADKAAGVGEVASTFMSHEEARRIYARRGDAIYQQMLGQYADENAAKAATKIALKREFGL